jgi:hypothetical protein
MIILRTMLSGLHPQQINRAVSIGRGQIAAVGRECHSSHPTAERSRPDDAHRIIGTGQVPQSNGVVFATRRQQGCR